MKRERQEGDVICYASIASWFLTIFVSTFLGFVALYFMTDGFSWYPILFGLCFIPLLCLPGPYLIVKPWPIIITADGIHGHSPFGRKRFIHWQEVRDARLFRFLNIRFLRLYSSPDQKITSITLNQSNPGGFHDTIQRLAPPDSPILKFVPTPGRWELLRGLLEGNVWFKTAVTILFLILFLFTDRACQNWNNIQVKVIAAARDLEVGTVITRECIGTISVPKNQLPNGWIHPDCFQSILRSKLTRPVKSNAPITWFMLASSERNQEPLKSDGGSEIGAEALAAAHEFLLTIHAEAEWQSNATHHLETRVLNELYQAAALEEFSNRYLTWEIIKDRLARLYADIFSTDELRELAAFFRTSAGQKFIQQQCRVVTEKDPDSGESVTVDPIRFEPNLALEKFTPEERQVWDAFFKTSVAIKHFHAYPIVIAKEKSLGKQLFSEHIIEYQQILWIEYLKQKNQSPPRSETTNAK